MAHSIPEMTAIVKPLETILASVSLLKRCEITVQLDTKCEKSANTAADFK